MAGRLVDRLHIGHVSDGAQTRHPAIRGKAERGW